MIIKKKISIIGLGYVGLPTAIGFHDAGFTVWGVDVSQHTVDMVLQGKNPTENVISFVTIAATGDAVDFGDMFQGVRHSCAVQSQTRGIVPGGWTNQPSGQNTDIIQYITTSTLGDSADFGDTTAAASRCVGSGSNAVRGVLHLGYTPTVLNTVDFITIATLGNAQDFGDLTEARFQAGGAASTTRLVVMGGSNPSVVDTMDYAQIMTTGNFIAFGELVGSDRSQTGGMSNGH